MQIVGVSFLDLSDDPWFIHAKSSPFCRFIVENKGVKYCEEVSVNHLKNE